MYVAITTVKIQPGHINTVLELFKKTNPDLVAGQEDWVRASFTANHAENEVTVLAFWRRAESYRTFAAGERFRQTMQQFQPYFAAPPNVSVKELLFEM